MNEWSSRIEGVVDGYVHMRAMADEASILTIREATGIEKMTGDTFRVPEAADFVLGPPEDGLIRGMSLRDDVLTRIYCDDFGRLVGSGPVL